MPQFVACVGTLGPGGRAVCSYVTSLAGLEKRLALCHKWSGGFSTWHTLP